MAAVLHSSVAVFAALLLTHASDHASFANAGALGSHGTWLLEPYSDMPETAGLNTLDLEVFRRTAELALEHGFQLNTHAIGDRGNREALDVYEATFRRAPDGRALRWRGSPGDTE